MLVVQITDLHVDPTRRLVGGRVDTAAAAGACVSHIEAMRPRPDLVIATGDLVQDGRVDQYTALAAALDRLSMPVAVIPGNHDDRAALRQVLAGRHGVDGGGPREAPIEPVVDLGPLRLIGIDSTIPGATHGGLDADRLERLDARLRERSEAPTLLFIHHPPFRTGVATMDRVGLRDGGDGLAAVIRRHPQVGRLVAGHVHRRIDGVFAGVPASTAPSTCHQIALDLTGGASGYVLEPAACALHLWRADAGFVSHLSYIGGFPGPIPFAVDA